MTIQSSMQGEHRFGGEVINEHREDSSQRANDPILLSLNSFRELCM